MSAPEGAAAYAVYYKNGMRYYFIAVGPRDIVFSGGVSFDGIYVMIYQIPIAEKFMGSAMPDRFNNEHFGVIAAIDNMPPAALLQ